MESLFDGSRSGRELYSVVLDGLGPSPGPALLVYEDIHRADQPTLELIDFWPGAWGGSRH